MALYSIDADDVDNICGKGEYSLIKSIHTTLTALDRKPRQVRMAYVSLKDQIYCRYK